MKMLVLQMLVIILAMVALVWGLLSIQKWYSKVVLVVSVLFVCLFGYISFLNYENTKANIIECYKLGGCQNNYSSDFIINYEKNLLAKKLKDQINTKIKKNETEDRPTKVDERPVTTIQTNSEEVKSDRESNLQSIRNKEINGR